MPQTKPQKRTLKDEPISFLVDSESKQKLEEIALAEDRSVGHVLREAIRQYLSRKTQPV